MSRKDKKKVASKKDGISEMYFCHFIHRVSLRFTLCFYKSVIQTLLNRKVQGAKPLNVKV